MALLWFEGFEQATNLFGIAWGGSSDKVGVTAKGRTGGYCLEMTSAGSIESTMGVFIGNTPSNDGTYIIGEAFYCNANNLDFAYAKHIWKDSAGKQLLGMDKAKANNGYWEFRDANDVLIDNTTVPWDQYQWQYIELKFAVGTSETVTVRLNGVIAATFNNVNTIGTSNGVINEVSVLWENDMLIDDMYICDTSGSINNDFLGPCRIVSVVPNADSSVGWTPLSGVDNWAMVDDSPSIDGDTTYNSASSQANTTDSFTCTNITLGPEEGVNGVRVHCHARSEGTGLAQIRLKCNNQLGDIETLSSTYNLYSGVTETSDGGTTAWSESSVNSMTIGVVAV